MTGKNTKDNGTGAGKESCFGSVFYNNKIYRSLPAEKVRGSKSVLTKILFYSNIRINQMVNQKRRLINIKITYANSRVEKFFTDYKRMQRELPAEWVRTIKKHMDRLEAADQNTVMICTEIEVEGIGDYHGRKENWYIS